MHYSTRSALSSNDASKLPIHFLLAAETDDGGAPATYEEALAGPESEGWKKAFAAEVESLNDNKVL